MQNHHFASILFGSGEDYGSHAYWALDDSHIDTAVVFIHGFNGQAIKTWHEFDERLPYYPQCQNVDLIFYGHDGGRLYVDESTLELYEFLQNLSTNPQLIFSRSFSFSMKRFNDFSYKKILVVAHSLGAFLVRRVLLKAHNDEEIWPQKIEMVLFAPAHCGTRTADWVTSFVSGLDIPFVKILPSLARRRYKVVDDIQAGSQTISDLYTETKKAQKNGKVTFLKAKEVLWSIGDDIVVNREFPGDPPPKRLSKGHQSICKPNDGYLDPIKILLQLI